MQTTFKKHFKKSYQPQTFKYHAIGIGLEKQVQEQKTKSEEAKFGLTLMPCGLYI